MNTHLKGFGLENFRVFKDYTWFDFAPITILTGPNNSGKSSLIKAILLIKENSTKGRLSSTLEFNSIIHNLSGWDGIINNPSSETIIFDYLTSSTITNFELIKVFENKFIAPLINKYNDGIISRSEYFWKALTRGFYNTDFNHKIVASFSANYKLFIDSDNLVSVILNVLSDIEKEKDTNSTIFNPKLPNDKVNIWVEHLRLFCQILKGSESWQIDLQKIYEGWSENNENKDFYSFLQSHLSFYEESIDGTLLIALQYLFIPVLSSNFDDKTINILIKTVALMLNSEKNSLDSFLDIIYLPALKGLQKRGFTKGDNHSLTQLIEGQLNKSHSQFIEKWGKKFGISEFSVNRDERLDINYITINERVLADLGYGFTQLAALILLFGLNENKIAILEEPESNLHPKLQSLIADLLTEQVYSTDDYYYFNDEKQIHDTYQVNKSSQFIVETHSEYMIRKFQYLVAKGEMKKEDINIYYFHDPNNVPAGEPQVKKIEILEDGSLSDDFGSGFFDEATNWKFELMELRKAQKN